MTKRSRNFQGPRLQAYKFFTRRAKAKLFFFFFFFRAAGMIWNLYPCCSSPFQWIYAASIMPQIKYNCKLVSLFVLIPMAFDAGFVDGGLNILSAVSLFIMWLSISMLWFIMLLYIRISCCKAHSCSTAWLYLYREPQPSRLRYSDSSNIIDDDRACMPSVYELDPIQCQGHRMRVDLYSRVRQWPRQTLI